MSPAVSTKTVKTKEAKDFNKSETEMVDVMDTLQHAISIIEMEIAKNLTVPAERNRYTEHELRNGRSRHDVDLDVNSLHHTVSMMMMKRTTEQITDVCMREHSRPRWDRTVPLNLGTLKTIEDAHNSADDWSTACIQSRRLQ